MLGLVHWDAANHFGLDSTLVHTALDLEEAIVAPVRVPRVTTEPVLLAIFNSPSKDTNGVALCFFKNLFFLEKLTSKGLSGVVRVDARFISGKVLIDDESALNWPVFVNLFHDGNFVRRKSETNLNCHCVELK